MYREISELEFEVIDYGLNSTKGSTRGQIWPYAKGQLKVYCEEYSAVKRLQSWRGCHLTGRYYHQGRLFGWDLIFPSKLYDRVAKLVGLPERGKNLKRVRQGAKMSVLNKKHWFSRNLSRKKGTVRPETAESRHIDTPHSGKLNLGQLKFSNKVLQEEWPKPGNSESK